MGPGGGSGKLSRNINITPGKEPWWWDMMKTRMQKEWEKNQPKVNGLETPEYKELQGQFDGYKTRQEARNSADYAGIKPKFFDRVYDLLDHSDGAKPVTEQLADLRKGYEEYFTPAAQPAANPAPKLPQFGAKPEGGMPKGEEGAVAAFTNAWGFSPKK